MDKLTDNQRRAIGTALGLLDAMLCDFERWADEGDIRSVLYQRTNRLTRDRVRLVRERAAEMRSTIVRLRNDLGLEDRHEEVATMIWSRAMGYLETLAELESRYLRAYGDVSPPLAKYLDPHVRAMSDCLYRLAEAVQTSGSGSAP